MKELEHKENLLGAPVEWERLAEPQPDRYDSHVALRLARGDGATRTPPAGPSLFDGAVALRQDPRAAALLPGCRLAPLDHPHLSAACELVRLWPAAFEQLRLLITSITPLTWGEADGCGAAGSVSGFGGRGEIALLVDDVSGLAQGLVSELARQKLGMLGNALDPGLLEPLLGQTSKAYSTALSLAILQSAPQPAGVRRQACESLAASLPELRLGLEPLERCDGCSARYLDGLRAWSRRLLAEAEAILARLAPRPRRLGNPLEYGVGEEMVLYLPEHEQAVSLNGSARAIWDLCDGRRTVPEICRELGRRFDRPGDHLARDVSKVVSALKGLGLLAVEETPLG